MLTTYTDALLTDTANITALTVCLQPNKCSAIPFIKHIVLPLLPMCVCRYMGKQGLAGCVCGNTPQYNCIGRAVGLQQFIQGVRTSDNQCYFHIPFQEVPVALGNHSLGNCGDATTFIFY